MNDKDRNRLRGLQDQVIAKIEKICREGYSENDPIFSSLGKLYGPSISQLKSLILPQFEEEFKAFLKEWEN